MARPLRIEFPDALYHVTSRGNEQRDIFRDDVDREMFLTFLGKAVKRFGWSVTAWVLMTNHFHLVIQTPDPNLSRGMHWLNGSYAGWFNRRHKRSGHLFQGRFHGVLVEKENYFRELLRYVVLNPVRANMVARPEDYRWSSYRSTAGLEAADGWLDISSILDLFDDDPTIARGQYQEFVLAKLDSSECLWDNAFNGIYLGTEAWAKSMRTMVESRPRSTDHPRAHRAVGRPKMATIVSAVAHVVGKSADNLREMRGGPLRRLVAWIGWHEGLVTLRSIAASLRLRSEGYVSNMIRRCEQEFGRNPDLLTQLDLSLASLRA
ncbi:MAG TPA: transposase [Thermoanaerobaculia bacterium]|nr:transposase [Thermoanaerobaculia bacterium]